VHRRSAILAILALVAACATNPQSKTDRTAPRVPTTYCLDTLHASDSVSAVVKMSVTPVDSTAKLPPDFEELFVDEFRSQFKLPSQLPLSVVMGSPPCDSLGSRCASASLNVGVAAYATAHNDGKLSDIEVIDAALTPSLADGVASALRAMSRLQAVPLSGDVESIPLMIQIAREDDADSVPAVRRLFKAKVPRYELPFRYATMPAAGVNAKYPFTARLAGVGDSVMIAFTVDSDGTIVNGSLELVRATYRDFVSSVLDALGRTHYHPAYLGDCPVATRMTQRFFFKVPELP